MMGTETGRVREGIEGERRVRKERKGGEKKERKDVEWSVCECSVERLENNLYFSRYAIIHAENQ